MNFTSLQRTYDGIVALSFYLYASKRQGLEVTVNKDMLITIDRMIETLTYMMQHEELDLGKTIEELKKLQAHLWFSETTCMINMSAELAIFRSQQIIHDYCKKKNVALQTFKTFSL